MTSITFRTKKWFLWALPAAVGNGVSGSLLPLIGLGEWYMSAFQGLLVGAIQILLLVSWCKGGRWWFWPIPCAIAWTAGNISGLSMTADGPFMRYISTVGAYTHIPSLAYGSCVGLITGLALVLLLKGATLPQVKEDT